MCFNYHAKVRRLIKSGQAESFEFLDNYNNISPCLLIHFKNSISMPIREHKFDEYKILLVQFSVPMKNNQDKES